MLAHRGARAEFAQRAGSQQSKGEGPAPPAGRAPWSLPQTPGRSHPASERDAVHLVPGSDSRAEVTGISLGGGQSCLTPCSTPARPATPCARPERVWPEALAPSVGRLRDSVCCQEPGIGLAVVRRPGRPGWGIRAPIRTRSVAFMPVPRLEAETSDFTKLVWRSRCEEVLASCPGPSFRLSGW